MTSQQHESAAIALVRKDFGIRLDAGQAARLAQVVRDAYREAEQLTAQLAKSVVQEMIKAGQEHDLVFSLNEVLQELEENLPG